MSKSVNLKSTLGVVNLQGTKKKKMVLTSFSRDREISISNSSPANSAKVVEINKLGFHGPD